MPNSTEEDKYIPEIVKSFHGGYRWHILSALKIP